MSINEVEEYWSNHTIMGNNIKNKNDSITYIKTIDELYPLYLKLFDLYIKHENKIVLDYGCGPGNDLVGFLLYSSCKKIIGIDISDKALSQAKDRLILHNAYISDNIYNEKGITLLKIHEHVSTINCPDNFIDYAQSSGVIHHTSNPNQILQEIFRVLKPGGSLKVMMYHRNSLWLQLAIPYDILNYNTSNYIPLNYWDKDIIYNKFKDLPSSDCFEYFADTSSNDKKGAPIAFLSDDTDFTTLANNVGFKGNFIDAAFCSIDLKSCLIIDEAINNKRFPLNHKDFLKKISFIKTNKIFNIKLDNNNLQKKINIDLYRLYEIEINIEKSDNIIENNNTLYINGCIDSLIQKEVIYNLNEELIIKKIYSNSDILNIKLDCNKNILINIKITEIYPLYDNKYYPGINAIYEFKKPIN